nr:hypothetical protein [Candidatus Freyarchaeota archaeon]
MVEEETLKEIDYKSILENNKKRTVLEELVKAGGQIQKSKLENSIRIPSPSLNNTLERLIKNGIITRDKDTIKLTRKTPLCYIFNSPKTPYAYLGLLGEKKKRPESETETALKLLTEKNFKFEKVLVITTEKGREDWKDAVPSCVEWHLVENEDINSVEKMESKIKTILPNLLRDYILIMDCTSLTVPATLAYYKLADDHKIPLIYIYETTKQLTWIKSKEHLQEKLITLPKTKKNKSNHRSVK